jgi:hypothetical protein
MGRDALPDDCRPADYAVPGQAGPLCVYTNVHIQALKINEFAALFVGNWPQARGSLELVIRFVAWH